MQTGVRIHPLYLYLSATLSTSFSWDSYLFSSLNYWRNKGKKTPFLFYFLRVMGETGRCWAPPILPGNLAYRSHLISQELGNVLRINWPGPGQVAQSVRVSSQYAKALGSISSQGTYKKQPLDSRINEKTNQSLSLFLSLPPSQISK